MALTKLDEIIDIAREDFLDFCKGDPEATPGESDRAMEEIIQASTPENVIDMLNIAKDKPSLMLHEGERENSTVVEALQEAIEYEIASILIDLRDDFQEWQNQLEFRSGTVHSWYDDLEEGDEKYIDVQIVKIIYTGNGSDPEFNVKVIDPDSDKFGQELRVYFEELS